MADVPKEFEKEIDSNEETFFKIAETLYENHGDQFTLGELAEKVDISNSQVSTHLSEPTKEDWVNKQEGETTFVWNTEKYNPVEIEAADAVFGLYTDLYGVFKNHTQTSTGVPAVAGLVLFVTSGMMLFLYGGVSVGLFRESAIPVVGYFVVGLALFITGAILTLLSPIMALANRTVLRIYQWINHQ